MFNKLHYFGDIQVEVNEIINKIDNGTTHINFTEFCKILLERSSEIDLEMEYKVSSHSCGLKRKASS